jgi:hypothetical protein
MNGTWAVRFLDYSSVFGRRPFIVHRSIFTTTVLSHVPAPTVAFTIITSVSYCNGYSIMLSCWLSDPDPEFAIHTRRWLIVPESCPSFSPTIHPSVEGVQSFRPPTGMASHSLRTGKRRRIALAEFPLFRHVPLARPCAILFTDSNFVCWFSYTRVPSWRQRRS